VPPPAMMKSKEAGGIRSAPRGGVLRRGSRRR
jgi:hypothetical protein